MEVVFGKPAGELFFLVGVLGVVGEVGPLVGVFFHVVEFFGAVGVLDVAPVLGADPVIVVVVRGEGRTGPRLLGVAELLLGLFALCNIFHRRVYGQEFTRIVIREEVIDSKGVKHYCSAVCMLFQRD